MAGESRLETDCCVYARGEGCKDYKLRSRGNAGPTDRIFALPGGVVIFVEFKTPDGTGRLSPLQKTEIEELQALRVPTYVCYHVEWFRRMLHFHLRRSHAIAILESQDSSSARENIDRAGTIDNEGLNVE